MIIRIYGTFTEGSLNIPGAGTQALAAEDGNTGGEDPRLASAAGAE